MSEEFVPTRVIAIRHGESQVTVRGVVSSARTCTGLSELGIQQATRLRDRLARTGEITATVLIASTYARARETAEIVAPALGLPVEIEADFGEHDPGPDCDGVAFAEFVERFGMPDWESDPHGITFPGGETVAEFDFRVGAALSRTLRRHAGGVIVIVCHGGVIDSFMRIALRTPSTGQFELNTSNTSLSEFVLTRPGRWRLVRYNDAAHLDGLPAATPRSVDQ